MASARAAVDAARINVVYTQVLSPITGQIGRTLVTEGALVTSGQQSAARHRAAARSHLRRHRAIVHRDAAPAAPAREPANWSRTTRTRPKSASRSRMAASYSGARPPQGFGSLGGSEHRLGVVARGVPQSAPRIAARHVRARAARAGHAFGGAARPAARRLAQSARRSHGAHRRSGRQGGGARGHRRSRHRGRMADHGGSHGWRSRDRGRTAEGQAGGGREASAGRRRAGAADGADMHADTANEVAQR